MLPLSSPEKGGGPKVGWTLDQKESIKSALFIGYVIMQVCFKKTAQYSIEGGHHEKSGQVLVDAREF